MNWSLLVSSLAEDSTPAVERPAPLAALAFGLPLLLCGLALLPLATTLARKLWRQREVVFARWGFSHALLALLAGVACMLVMGFIPGEGTLASIGRSLSVLVAVSAVAFWGCKRMESEPWKVLGLRADGIGRAAGMGALTYVMLLPVLVGVHICWPALLDLMEIEWAPQAVAEMISGLQGGELAVACILAVAVQPFFEEFIFRGFLQPLMVQNFGDRGGMLLTSLAFASLHGVAVFPQVLALSLLLSAIMLRTQRLYAAWAVHALHNGLQLLLMFQVSS